MCASKSDVCLCWQPDLLNFKKGWMVKLEGSDQVNDFFLMQILETSVFFANSSVFLPPLVDEVLVCALY